MKLDEAIKHAEQVAEEKEAKVWFDGDNENIGDSCLTCAEEHRQLAEWLKDYKRLKEQEPCEDAISREEALEGLNSINGTSELDKAFEVIENLPPVTPQGKLKG